jgi:L-lactate dehydrogenase (cytochrome)
LRIKAKKNIPEFAFDYLDGGCNNEENLNRNIQDLKEIILEPKYLRNYKSSSTKTSLFGIEYDVPFGISPIGLQGLIWPNSSEILAKSALKHNIPFILSSVTTMDIEKTARLTDGNFWFQLYNPIDENLRKDILKRAYDSGCKTLVILADVPKNILQILGKPNWALNTLIYGQPRFKNLSPYIKKNMSMSQLGKFMDETFSGRINPEIIEPIREQWKGNLVLKGVSSISDAKDAIKIGFDGIIVSNHGGRQLDAGNSSIKSLTKMVKKIDKNKIEIMIDSGFRSGPDVARALAIGANFVFMGRPFMYGTAALGSKGGNHTISILKKQFQQVMDQLCCEKTEDLPNYISQ